VYLGIGQYQLLFDWTGLGILLVAALVVVALFVQASSSNRSTAYVLSLVLVLLGATQFLRGWMVPNEAWLSILANIEVSDEQQRIHKLTELSQSWNADAETISAMDWYFLSRRWNACHALWRQANCNMLTPSEPAVGVAREMLNDMVRVLVSHRGSE
jgi:hypothetical protein